MAKETQTQAVTERPVDKLTRMLNSESVMTQFQNALKDNARQFVASVIDLYSNDAALQKCDPKAIVTECLKAAVLNLPISKALGFAYIVVYNTNVKMPDGTWQKVPTPTFIPGYKGYIQLAQRTGQYKIINADVVYEGELSAYDKLTGEITFNGTRESDKVVGYFAYIELLNGYRKMLYMSLEDMAKYAKRYSKGLSQKTSVADLEKIAQSEPTQGKVGWEGNFNDMAIKTVIRRLLSKYGYLSIEMMSNPMRDIDEQAHQEGERNATIEGTAVETIDLQEEMVAQAEEKVIDEQPGY